MYGYWNVSKKKIFNFEISREWESGHNVSTMVGWKILAKKLGKKMDPPSKVQWNFAPSLKDEKIFDMTTTTHFAGVHK